jgi:glycosyltransferase involved in cell wall biosynthesis
MEKAVLIISPFFSPNTGGVETHLDDLCQVLAEKNIKAYVITYQPLTTRAKGKRFEQRGSVKIMRMNWYGHNLFHIFIKYPFLELIYLFPGIFLKSLIFMSKNRNKISAIHSHGMLASFVAKLLKCLFKKRIVASTHAIYDFQVGSLLAKVIKSIIYSFDEILAISQQSKRELVSIGINPDKIKVYRYWVDQEVFKPLDKNKCRDKINWKNKFVILFVGRLLEIKGIRLLIEAAASLSQDIHIAIIGDGPLENEVVEAARHNRRIIFVGNVPNKELSIYYNAADSVIVPSIYEEACGRIILEALSCSTPVIASNRGGITEVLSKEAGLIITPNLENIVNSINSLYRDSQKLQTLSLKAREYALERFSKNNSDIIISSYNLGT